MGDVGLNLLWERNFTASSTALPKVITVGASKPIQFGLVMPYDLLMKTYKTLFRDGSYTFKNDEQLKQAKQFMGDIRYAWNPCNLDFRRCHDGPKRDHCKIV